MPKKINKLSSLSVFFPAFNEADSISEAVSQAHAILPRVAKRYEIIVINDGSKDATAETVKQLRVGNKKIRLVNQRNRGYGGALKRGFKEAKYDWIFYTDSDLQFDVRELLKLVRETSDDKLAMVLGYRKNRAEGIRRQILAIALKIWNRLLLGFPAEIKDIDCAFKLLRKDVLRTIEPLFSDGAMVSTELLLKSIDSGFQFTQVGVSHYKRRAGTPTGSNVFVILRAIKDTLILKKMLIAQQLAQGARLSGALTRSLAPRF